MDVLPSVIGIVLVVGHAEVVVDVNSHNVTTLQEYAERQRLSFATGSPSLQGDFTCFQCAALAIQRDIVVWVVGVEHEVKFGSLGSMEPLRLLYTGDGKSGHYIPVVDHALIAILEEDLLVEVSYCTKGRLRPLWITYSYHAMQTNQEAS